MTQIMLTTSGNSFIAKEMPGPDHLYLGTQRENMQGAAGKWRLSVPRTRTFSLSDRLAIYHAKRYRGICVDLANRYGVTKACISLIRRGRFIGSGVWSGTKGNVA